MLTRTMLGITKEGHLTLDKEDVYTCDYCGELPEEGEELVRRSNHEGGDAINIICLCCDEE